VDAAGFPRVTAAIEAMAAQSTNVLKLHAGDAVTGTLYFNRAGADGEADMAMLNTVCFDAYTLGNHEFDKGDTGLKGILDRLKNGKCTTPVLSANVQFGASSALKSANLVSPSTVVERGGHKIGIVGLTIAQKTKASSSPDKDTLFEDEAVAAQREIDKLQAQGVKRIVLLS
ncbi:MAG: bifunctional metallophosphatase/5'-nucleotidase, partial [Comamonas sp.]